MHIIDNTIYFKSDDEFYFKEEAGIQKGFNAPIKDGKARRVA